MRFISEPPLDDIDFQLESNLFRKDRKISPVDIWRHKSVPSFSVEDCSDRVLVTVDVEAELITGNFTKCSTSGGMSVFFGNPDVVKCCLGIRILCEQNLFSHIYRHLMILNLTK